LTQQLAGAGIVELIEHTPLALILDEFQTWYEGLASDARASRRLASQA